MRICIKNWDEFNPRKDLKSMPWIRIDSSIGFSESLFGLSHDAKWLWIFLLSYSGRKISGSFEIEPAFLSHYTEISIEKIEKYIIEFEKRGLLIGDHSVTIGSDRITNGSDRITNGSVPYEENEENEEYIARSSDLVVYTDDDRDSLILEIAKLKSKKMKFDIESIYAEYPLKKGKKKGIEKLNRIIKTQETFDKVLMAVKNYKTEMTGQEERYIKHFSTFVGVWEDSLEITLPSKEKDWAEKYRGTIYDEEASS